jgi:hypothetical protein
MIIVICQDDRAIGSWESKQRLRVVDVSIQPASDRSMILGLLVVANRSGIGQGFERS